MFGTKRRQPTDVVAVMHGMTQAELHAAGQVEQALTFARRVLMVCVGLAVLAVVPWAVIWHVARQPQPPPEVIVVDPGHMVLFRHPITGNYDQQKAIRMGAFQEWIAWVRERREDPIHQEELRNKALAMTDGAARQQVQDYWKEADANPNTRANPFRVQVGQFIWRPASTREYSVDWTEIWSPMFGTMRDRLQVSGRFLIDERVVIDPFGRKAATVADQNVSPFGFSIIHSSWMERWVKDKDKEGGR